MCRSIACVQPRWIVSDAGATTSRSAEGRSRPSVLRGNLVEFSELGGSQLQCYGADVLLEMGDLRGSWDGQHGRRMREQPGKRDLARRRTVLFGDVGQQTPGPAELADFEWVP